MGRDRLVEAVEVIERLLRATVDNPVAGDLHLARHKAKQFLEAVSLDEPAAVLYELDVDDSLPKATQPAAADNV